MNKCSTGYTGNDWVGIIYFSDPKI